MSLVSILGRFWGIQKNSDRTIQSLVDITRNHHKKITILLNKIEKLEVRNKYLLNEINKLNESLNLNEDHQNQ